MKYKMIFLFAFASQLYGMQPQSCGLTKRRVLKTQSKTQGLHSSEPRQVPPKKESPAMRRLKQPNYRETCIKKGAGKKNK